MPCQDRIESCPRLFIDDPAVDYAHPWKLGNTKQLRHPLLAMQEEGRMVYLPV